MSTSKEAGELEKQGGTASSTEEQNLENHQVPEHEKNETLALERKNKGNELFAKFNFVEAYDEYSEAILYAPETEEFKKQLSVFYCNRAACSLELKRYEDTIRDCTEALELDNRYVKALVRRYRAHEKLDHLEEALADMDSLLSIDPKSVPNLKSERDKMEVRMKEKQEKMKEEVLGKLKEMGNTILGKFGLSLDNFKMEQDPNSGSYSVNFKQ